MGLKATFLRARMFPQLQFNKEEDDKSSVGCDNANKIKKPTVEDKERIDALVNTYTYFNVYDGITSRLGNFYSETLAKIKGPQVLAKRLMNELYNGTLQSVVKQALDSAGTGEKLDFTQLAEKVKEQVLLALEECNYDYDQYQKNKINDNIKENCPRFNQ